MKNKELTAHVRELLSKAGIKARCKMQECCGSKVIAIDTPTFKSVFTPEQQTLMFNIVTGLGLTHVRGLPVVDNGTMTHGGKFYITS